MHKNTGILRQEILNLYDDSYSRVKHLKDKYKGETAYILATGPSFASFEQDYLKDFFKDKLVLSIKQTYHTVEEEADFHLMNFCNVSDYEYKSPDTIAGWLIWDAYQPYQIINSGTRCDFILDTYKLGNGAYDFDNSMPVKKELEKLSLDYHLARPWGGGITCEIAIPLAMYLGCKKIVTVGWDLYGSTINKYKNELEKIPIDHSWKQLKKGEEQMTVGKKEILTTIDFTEDLNRWMKEQDVVLQIVDPFNENPAHESIERVSI